jgi:hypothetical protein
MSEPGTLLDFLTSRSPEQLAAILRHRTDVTWGAPIAGLDDLAERLTGPMSLTRALQSVPEPCRALCHAVVALGPSTTSGASPARAITVDSISTSLLIRTQSKGSPSAVIRRTTDRRRCRSIPTNCRPEYNSLTGASFVERT